jgi:hypothetical protein
MNSPTNRPSDICRPDLPILVSNKNEGFDIKQGLDSWFVPAFSAIADRSKKLTSSSTAIFCLENVCSRSLKKHLKMSENILAFLIKNTSRTVAKFFNSNF